MDKRKKEHARAGGKNMRRQTYFWLLCAVLFLFMVTAAGAVLGERAVATDFSRKNLTPCIPYLFGTEWIREKRSMRGQAEKICGDKHIFGCCARCFFCL